MPICEVPEANASSGMLDDFDVDPHLLRQEVSSQERDAGMCVEMEPVGAAAYNMLPHETT